MRKKVSVKWIVLTAAVLAVVAGCSRGADDTAAASWAPVEEEVRTLAVEALTVTTGRLIPSVQASGVVSGINEAWVVSETEGIITDVAFEIGDRVEADQLLVKVDDVLTKQARDLTEQQLSTARLNAEANKKTFDNGGISRLQMSQAQDGLLLAENAFTNADEAYKDTFLRAPFAGSVAVKDTSLGVGNYLSRGVPVARIIDDSAFTMQLSVGERHVGLLRSGIPAVVETSAGRMDGIVKAVAAGSNEATGSFAVIVTWPNPGDGSLKAGMSARVTIDTSDAEETIVIPASSVLYRGGAPVVFVEEDGKSVPRPVTLGERLGDRQQVLSGLTPGETLIISGLASLAPDYPVTATSVGESGGRS